MNWGKQRSPVLLTALLVVTWAQTGFAQNEHHYVLSNEGSATLVVNTPNYRAAANRGNQLAVLPVGTQVEVLATRSDPALGQILPWSQIRVLNGPQEGLVGWVSGRTVHRKPGKADPSDNAPAQDSPADKPTTTDAPPTKPTDGEPPQPSAPQQAPSQPEQAVGPKSLEGLDELREEISELNTPMEVPSFSVGDSGPAPLNVDSKSWGHEITLEHPDGLIEVKEYKDQHGNIRTEVREENYISQGSSLGGLLDHKITDVTESAYVNGVKITSVKSSVSEVDFGTESLGIKYQGAATSGGNLDGGIDIKHEISSAVGPRYSVDGKEEWFAGTLSSGVNVGVHSADFGNGLVHSQGLNLPGLGYNYSHSPSGTKFGAQFGPFGAQSIITYR